MNRLLRFLLLLAAAGYGLAHSGEVSVAVASNFAGPMQKIAAAFAQASGHTATLSLGATGKFYAQIKNGAPFEVLLSADADTTARLEQEKLGVAGSRFIYATGRLALWSSKAGLIDGTPQVLHTGRFERIAIANPKVAPYGLAAQQTMTRLGVLGTLKERLVQGESIAQTYQFVASSNAALGFVALAQIMQNGTITQGSAWLVPADHHAPIHQEALLLQTGKNNEAAIALLAFLKTEQARAIIRTYGYDI
jgi:molybdate transport system substrate-binding protein